MKKAALDKANARIDAAREAFKRINSSQNFDQFLPAWVDFLSALKGVHSIFEASATPKKDPQAYSWYSKKVFERRKDALLRYIHAARNAEEYGVEPIAEHVPGFTAIGVGGEPVHIKNLSIGVRGEIQHAEFYPVDGRLPTIVTAPSHPRLITVHDERFGDSFDPPAEHLGKPLKTGSVQEVATLALAYHECLIKEAEKYAP